MKFAKTTEYAIRVITYLASKPDQLLSVNHMHQQLNIPYKYLGQLMSKLSASGLVEAFKGKQGGYRINQVRMPIYLSEIIEIVEGLADYDRCILGFPECSDSNPCSLHHLWLEQLKGIREIIYTVSVEDLVKNKPTKF